MGAFENFYTVYNDETLKALEPFLRTVPYNAIKEQVRDRRDRLCIGLMMDFEPERDYSQRIKFAGYVMCSHKKLHARAIRVARRLQIGEGNRHPKRPKPVPPVVVFIGRKKHGCSAKTV